MKYAKMLFMAFVAMVAVSSCRFVKLGENLKDVSTLKHVVKMPDVIEFQSWSEEITDFNSVIINVPAKVRLSQGDECKVSVTAPDEIVKDIQVRQKDNTVSIFMSPEAGDKKISGLKLQVVVKDLRKLRLNMACEMKASDLLSEDLQIETNGAADLNIDGLSVSYLTVVGNGASDIDITGLKALSTIVTVNGAGDISLAGKSGEAFISVNGAADIDIEELDCPSVTKKINGLAKR